MLPGEHSALAGAIYNQAQAIGEAAGLNSVAFAPYGNPTEIMSPNQGGVAVISRWPIRATRNRRLPTAHDTPPDARVALLVTVAAANRHTGCRKHTSVVAAC